MQTLSTLCITGKLHCDEIDDRRPRISKRMSYQYYINVIRGPSNFTYHCPLWHVYNISQRDSELIINILLFLLFTA